MTKRVTQLSGMAASLLTLAASATAEVKLTENFSTSGYLAGSYQYWSPKTGASSDRFDLDAAHLLFSGSFKPVTGVVSFYHTPDSDSSVKLLDAYATYDAGNGVSITGGKFLSWLGYESFFNVNNPTISFANGDFLGAIPGYHAGVKVEYADKMWAAGFGLLDSVYTPPGSTLKGDGELKSNAGFELYEKYTGVEGLVLWAGLAHDTAGQLPSQREAITTWDLWAQYDVAKNVMVAAEFAYKNGGDFNKGYNWLVLMNYKFTDRVNTAFRISGEKIDGTNEPKFLRFTAAPGIAVTSNLTVRGELSYTDYKNISTESAMYYGVQAYFKF